MSQQEDGQDVLETMPREAFGKGAARALRRAGRLPAVVYGGKADNASLNGERLRVLPKQVQLHPVRDDLLHVDFLRLDKGAVIAVEVPVRFLNEDESPGLKRGGVLNVVRHTVELNCPADAIPEFIEVDLAGRDIGDSIHISAVRLPERATPVITGRDFTIAGIVAPAVMPEETGAAAEEGDAEAEAKPEKEDS